MNARILVIEDDPVTRGLIGRYLESQDYRVDAVEDGMAAIERLQNETYQLALLDYHMPDLDGFTAARLMRKLSANTLKIAAITSDHRELTERIGDTALFDGVLAKPVTPQALFDFVANLLNPPAEGPHNQAAAAFVRKPQSQSGRLAAAAFWQARGLHGCPRAAALPPPNADQAEALGLCFELSQPADAEVILLLHQSGSLMLSDLRAGSLGVLAPAVDAGANVLGLCETTFRIGDPESWTQVAGLIAEFATRLPAINVAARTSPDIDTRLLSYVFLTQSSLRIARGASGTATFTGTGGFAHDVVESSALRLASAGLLDRRVHADAASGAVLETYDATTLGIECITGSRRDDTSPQPAVTTPADHLFPAAASLPQPQRGDEACLHLLVAIEQAINREITTSMLTAVGHMVDGVATADAVNTAMASTAYDLVVIDAHMEDASGATAPAAIRRACEVPMLVVGANIGTLEADAMRDAGIEAVLLRPFRSQDLYAEVARVVHTFREAGAIAFDAQTFDGLLQFMNERSRRFLAEALAAQIETATIESFGSKKGRSALAAVAHTMISAAGMLGFNGLSDCCRNLCDTLRKESDVDLKEFASVCGSTRAFILAMSASAIETERARSGSNRS